MKKKILIADDDREFVESIREILEESGYETISAYEGIRTVQKAHKEHPNLIILDWKMPAGKGSSVLELLHKENATRHIPVIVLTGVEEPGMEEVSKQFGVKSFLRKPHDMGDLLKKIGEALS